MEEPGLPLWYLAPFWSHVTDGLAFFEQGPSGGPVLLPSWLYPLLSFSSCLGLRSQPRAGLPCLPWLWPVGPSKRREGEGRKVLIQLSVPLPCCCGWLRCCCVLMESLLSPSCPVCLECLQFPGHTQACMTFCREPLIKTLLNLVCFLPTETEGRWGGVFYVLCTHFLLRLLRYLPRMSGYSPK